MPRIPRGTGGSHYFHVLNRANGRATLFHQVADYRAFIQLLRHAKPRFGVELHAFCVMPNHFHLVLRVEETLRLSRFMQWWLTSHVRRYHRFFGTSGHLWQGRFKSFPVQDDVHLLTVLRYVLLNPVRAKLAADAWDWPWTSLHFAALTKSWPIQPPRDLASWLREPQSQTELEDVRLSVLRRSPFGDDGWTRKVAAEAGLEATLRPRGRPARAA